MQVRSAPDYVIDRGPGSGARTPARSWLRSDAAQLSLNGEWDFRLSPHAGASEDFAYASTADDAGFSPVQVPHHWVLEGLAEGEPRYGLPSYTNVKYPFPVDPPFVPDANPTGDYRRSFTLPQGWAGQVLLRFDGVESTYKVWLNGREIGVGKGSRLVQEFDVTSALRPGQNQLAVRVHQFSAVSYIEDQDQWWLPGIFRDVTLLHRPDGGLTDVWVDAGFTVDQQNPQNQDGGGVGTGTLRVQVVTDSYPVTVSVPELDFQAQLDGEWGTWEVTGVEPWSAETPRLYEASVSNAAEEVTLKLGFRTVKIEGDQFLVNGRRVVFNGVNRHETHPVRGRVFDREHARAELAQMKQHNINAVRTSHYPPHPEWLELADELGVWVILECDIEAHGLWVSRGAENPSDDPRWRDAYLDRMQRTLERDKNHSSIIMWSLGNESGTGRNMAANSAWVHRRDPGRPVHYEGDYRGQYTDVYSRMYSPVAEVESIGQDTTAPLHGTSPAEAAVQRSKPFVLCEYVHAMGNGPGGIERYEELVYKHQRLHGGFVWEWRDHGLLTRTAEGTPFYGYGGDFGEEIHDGNFVMDGLLFCDDTPSPGLLEFAAVVAPVQFVVTFDELGIFNQRHTASTADLRFYWTVEHQGVSIGSGELELGALEAGGFARTSLSTLGLPDISADGETWLTVEARQRSATDWCDADHVTARFQHRLGAGLESRVALRTESQWEAAADGSVNLGAAVKLPLPQLELWRAPIDNDRLYGAGSYDLVDPEWKDSLGIPGFGFHDEPDFGASHMERWLAVGLDRLHHRVINHTEGDGWVQRVTRIAPANSAESVLTTATWRTGELNGTAGVVLEVDIQPSPGWDTLWPRIGVRFDLPWEISEVSWFGLGPGESYPDSLRGVHVGRFTATPAELFTNYPRPQENGHRSAVRELTISTGNGTVRAQFLPDVDGSLPGFTLSKYTAQELGTAGHPYELPQKPGYHLYIDAAQNGLGSRSCGPDVWPSEILRPSARSLSMFFSAEN